MLIDIDKFFENNIKESVGCTEPAAIALAVAAAFNAVKGWLPSDPAKNKPDLSPREINRAIERIIVRTDRGVFKNALQVTIPNGQGMKGIDEAAALGVFCDPGMSLELFDSLDEDRVSSAKDLLKSGKIDTSPQYDWSGLRIEAEAKTKSDTGVAYITDDHSNISYIEVNGQLRFRKPATNTETDELRNLSQLGDFIEVVDNELRFEPEPNSAAIALQEAVITNHRASLVAEQRFRDLGRHSLGLAIRSFVREGYVAEDCLVLAKEKVSLTVEARMTGFDVRIATCAGSGNMGIVSTLPLLAMGLCEFSRSYPNYDIDWDSVAEVIQKKASADWRRLIRAVGLVHLIANYTSLYSGKLSASCGCGTRSGVGLAAGLAYYLTPPNDKDRLAVIADAINGMARSIFGMICDGGKEGCALKTSAATGVAMESALLACRRLHLSPSDGIANTDAIVTLRNIGMISDEMGDIDRKIIELVRDKNKRTTIEH